MRDILKEIAAYTKVRLDVQKQSITDEMMKSAALDKMCNTGFPFEKALSGEELSFICECKKASPSRGIIDDDFQYLAIAEEYAAAGADCISVLTEPHWFMGRGEYLQNIAAAVSVPCLRKDFIIDEYMIYEAKVLGADAVLLICSLLDGDVLKRYLQICSGLGLSALVEAHDREQIDAALAAGAGIIGINNRNLQDFSVDIGHSAALRNSIPDDVLFVAESGISSPEDVRSLREAGADAVLIGEAMMRADDRRAYLNKLRSAS